MSHPVATPGFRVTDGRLACHGVDLVTLADNLGTPLYVYDLPGILARYHQMHAALAPIGASLRYAVKANAAPAILRALVAAGAGMDVVSIGELERAWLAGCPMDRICFAGVAKGDHELRAALDGRASPIADAPALLNGRDPAARGPVGLINIESESEARCLAEVAGHLGVAAPVAVRINPGVSAGANDKVRVGGIDSKFGLAPAQAVELAASIAAQPAIAFRGLHMHIGSQIHDTQRFDEALAVMLGVVSALQARGIAVDTLDVGGGLAVSYLGEATPSDSAYASVLIERLAPLARRGVRILTEPGREIVAQAGVLLTRVRHVKHAGERRIIITDAGLNALVRPAMYGARHFIWPCVPASAAVAGPITPPPAALPGLTPADVVGPVCESSDVFQRGEPMPEVRRGDVLAVFTTGAYGMSMAMTFNDLPLPAEAVIDADGPRLIRPHQRYADMLAPGAQR